MKGSARRRKTNLNNDQRMEMSILNKAHLSTIESSQDNENLFPRRSPIKTFSSNQNFHSFSMLNDSIEFDFYRNSFHESERTDSGFGGENSSASRLTQSYHLLSQQTLHGESMEIDERSADDFLRKIRLEKTG